MAKKAKKTKKVEEVVNETEEVVDEAVDETVDETTEENTEETTEEVVDEAVEDDEEDQEEEDDDEEDEEKEENTGKAMGIATTILLQGRDMTEKEKMHFDTLRENIGVTPKELKHIVEDKESIKKYNLSKQDVKICKKALKEIEQSKISHLDVTQTPDDVRAILQKYGATFKHLQEGEDSLKELGVKKEETKTLLTFFEKLIYG